MIRADAPMPMKHRLPASKIVRTPVRLTRMLVALAIMLVAVLPHATMAAGFAMGNGTMAHGMAVASPSALEPCHETRTDDAARPDRPACCVMGCGLIAQLIALPALAMLRSWSVIDQPNGTIGVGTALEPAERPPRRWA